MTWDNVAFLLMGFFSGGVLVGYVCYRWDAALFQSLARIQEAHNEMVKMTLEERREGEK